MCTEDAFSVPFILSCLQPMRPDFEPRYRHHMWVSQEVSPVSYSGCPLSTKINQCTLQLKYTKVLSSHTLVIAALYGMARPNSLVRNFKNFKIVLSELSPNLAMILVPDFFLTRLDGAIYRLEGLNKRLMYKCINNLAPAYLCNLFAPRTPKYYFRNAKKKINGPKTEH